MASQKQKSTKSKEQGRTSSNTRLGDSERDETTTSATGQRSRSGSNASTSSVGSKGAVIRLSKEDREAAESVANRTRSSSRSVTPKTNVGAQSETDTVIVVSDTSRQGMEQSSSEEEHENDGAQSDTGSQQGSQSGKRQRTKDDNSPPVVPTKRRGPGRPEVTGDYRVKKAVQAERNFWENREEELCILNPVRIAQVSRAEAKLRSETELAEEYKEKPTLDLTAEAMESVTVIRNMADKSANLKGSLQKGLREKANSLIAVATILATRAQCDANS